MKASRIALGVTLLVVAALASWFAVARWSDANKVASILSGLGAIAAIGIAVWSALRSSESGPRLTVSGTGKASAEDRGQANSGLTGKPMQPSRDIEIKDTGDATASGDGKANTGLQGD